MRVVCIADPHGRYFGTTIKLPPGDVLVVAGDLCLNGTLLELEWAAAWLGTHINPYRQEQAQFKNIIVIGGNHDFPFQVNPMEARNLLRDQGITYLQDEAVTIEGVKFYGSPWTPTFFNWAFMKDRGEEIQQEWAKIPTDVDVLITHGPPYGILDPGFKAAHVGCEDLLFELENRISPKLHVFGHLHSGYGELDRDGIHYVNASLVNEAYSPVNSPIVIDL